MIAIIDPYVWCLTLPLGIALFGLLCVPEGHIIKRVWDELMKLDARVLEALGCSTEHLTEEIRLLQHHCLVVSAWGMLFLSGLSLVCCLGG